MATPPIVSSLKPALSGRPERRLHGDGVAPGIACGRPCFVSVPTISTTNPSPIEVRFEQQRVRTALLDVRRDIAELAAAAAERGDSEARDIFTAHGLILADETLESAVLARVTDDASPAAAAIDAVFDDYCAAFGAIADDYLSARTADFAALKNQLLGVLSEQPITRHCRDATGCKLDRCALGNPHILVGGTLDAHLTARLDVHTVGLVVASGSARSHGALIARALGIPAVSGITDAANAAAACGAVLVDGGTGLVVLDPSSNTLQEYAQSLRTPRPHIRISTPLTAFAVMADLDRASRVDDVAAAGADGIGLYRTEMELLAHGRMLDENAQADLYTRVVRAAAGRPLQVRLFDLGYDKSVPELELPAAGNPALGLRGARLLLERPDIVRVQARALARAARHGPLRIVYPMITSVGQFRELRQLFTDTIAELDHGTIEHGVMLEVPAACLQAEALFELADFGLVGSSDLTQYLFALDRELGGAAFQDCLNEPTLWTLLGDLARGAAKAGKQLSVCGVVASNAACTAKLIASGIKAVSVEPRYIEKVRQTAVQALRGMPA